MQKTLDSWTNSAEAFEYSVNRISLMNFRIANPPTWAIRKRYLATTLNKSTKNIYIGHKLRWDDKTSYHWDKAGEISDFADLLIKRYEEQLLIKGIAQLTVNSEALTF